MTSPISLATAVGIGNAAQTAAGTTQATATALLADHVSVPSVASGAGVILNPANGGEVFSVANGDATDPLLIYPPVGSSFNGTTVNTALTLPAGRAALFIFISPTVINAVY